VVPGLRWAEDAQWLPRRLSRLPTLDVEDGCALRVPDPWTGARVIMLS
jgi:hypothetical protein